MSEKKLSLPHLRRELANYFITVRWMKHGIRNILNDGCYAISYQNTIIDTADDEKELQGKLQVLLQRERA